jgi:eukaryotic-like serine/threonine-protein kinase
MELVRGISIIRFCDQQHLGIRERLELFTHVCQAVQHAHQKGIIHRDLKPSNVMVTQHDVTPVVKIIDFGIAKATGQQLTDKTLFTNFAQMIGTPMYMSPEQAQMSGLDVDTRSDVYSLGVLLYELLTGNTPFERERLSTVAFDEMIRIIREEEPLRPSTRISTLGNAANTVPIDRNSTPQQLSRLLRGELDWIVMKALEKDRNRRYESASALANEVQRYLHDEPVLACPPSVSYRLQKMARRHKAALATAAMVFVALSAGTAVAIWQAVVATQAAAAEKNAKIEAEAKEAEARAVISFLEDRVISAAQPEGQDGGLGHDVSLRRAIEAAVPFVEGGFKDQPLIEARLRMTLGHSFRSLGEPKKSGEQYAAALALYSKLHGANHESSLNSKANLAGSYVADSRYTEARQLCDETLTQARKNLGLEHKVTLLAMDTLAASYDGLSQHGDALKIREEVVRIRTKTLGPKANDTIQSLTNLAISYANLDRHADALEIEEKALEIRLAQLGPDNVQTLECANNVAVSYMFLGRLEESRKKHEDVLARRKSKLGLDHTHTLQSMSNLSDLYDFMGQPGQALPLHKQALDLSKAKYGLDHIATMERMSVLADCYRRLGQSKVAVELSEEALRLLKLKRGPDHRSTLNCMYRLALAYQAVGRREDALEVGKETLTRRIAVLGADHTDTLWSMNYLGVLHSELGQHDEALAWHEKTLAARTAKWGAGHPDALTSLLKVAGSLIRLDRGSEAATIMDDCVQRALHSDVPPTFLADLTILRTEYFVKAKDLAGCRATAAMWDNLGRTDMESHYNTACAHAIVASMIRDLDQSWESEIHSNLEADRAIVWLRKAVAAGYRNVAHMSKDSDLDVLRKRPDFINLIAELAVEPKKVEK